MTRRELFWVVSPLAVQLARADWPQFRGPGGRGVPAQQAGLPETWSDTRNVDWKIGIPGAGWSSPIVMDGKVFLTSALADDITGPPKGGFYEGAVDSPKSGAEHRWLVHCLDVTSGEPEWQTEVHRGIPRGSRHRKNTYASETAVTEGEYVYVHVGDLATWALDYKGNILWEKPWMAVQTRWGYGTASSPALHQNRLYITNDNEEQSYIVALDKLTGQEIWRVNRNEPTTWSTPFVWENGLRTEIVTAGRNKVRSYDLDGKLLWELSGMSALSIPTPFSAGDFLYVTSGYIGSPERPIYAIRPGAKGDISPATGSTSNEFVAWSVPQGGPYHPSAVVYQGLYYTLYDRGFLRCHDARTGVEVYGKQRISRESVNFTASMWAYNGKIFCLDESGTTYVIEAGQQFKLLGMNPLGEMCMATPAITDEALLIRTYSSLYRIRA